MKVNHLIRLGVFGISTILFRRKKAILGTIILTDKCNLHCAHCSVNNITAVIHPYDQIRREMEELYRVGIRILFFCGGETFLWSSGGKTLRDLVAEAKSMGFYIVNAVTNGTFPLNLPEADLILLSLDGDRDRHNLIRGDTYDAILKNIDEAASDNICLYMAINKLNQNTIRQVCDTAREKRAVRAVSFNFHTPYPETAALALDESEKQACCDEISGLMEEGYPVFNLRSAFTAIVRNRFPTPCYQCVVMENGERSVCGRCVHVPGLCGKCGYFFAAEYALVFSGNLRVAADMLRTYPKYI